MKLDGLAQHAVIEWQQHLHQRQRQNERHQRHQDRFAQKLRHQLAAAGAHHLSQRYLARAHHRPGSSQVGEVETGDEQDQRADGSKAIDAWPSFRPASGTPDLTIGGKMIVAERREIGAA